MPDVKGDKSGQRKSRYWSGFHHVHVSDPDRIQTCDPQLRRLLLYSAELPDHFIFINSLPERPFRNFSLFPWIYTPQQKIISRGDTPLLKKFYQRYVLLFFFLNPYTFPHRIFHPLHFLLHKHKLVDCCSLPAGRQVFS